MFQHITHIYYLVLVGADTLTYKFIQSLIKQKIIQTSVNLTCLFQLFLIVVL